MHVPVLLPEDLYNRVARFLCIAHPEGGTLPLPVVCPTDGLTELTRQHCVMVALGYRLILLLSARGGSDLPGGPFRLGILHQYRMETPLPEVHPPGDLRPDLLVPTDAQRLREDDGGKDKGSLGVPTPVS